MNTCMTWEPHEYQRRALKKMLSQRSVGLFMDPGLGKSSTVLEAYRILKREGVVGKMLIVAPLRPVYNVWPQEIAKWENFNHLTYTILHGPKKSQRLDDDVDIYIINPEGLNWLYSQKSLPKFDVLCVDESTKFKNSSTKRFKLMRKHLLDFKIRWILTGTPSPNGVQDLFGQVYILDRGHALGSYITHFRNRFMYQADFMGYDWQLKEGAYEEITENIKPLVIQLTAEDHLDMPELIRTEVEVELPPAAMKSYKEVEEHFLTLLEEGAIVASNAGAAGTKCRQIANGAVYMDGVDSYATIHDAKLDALEELLEELGDKPVLLLYEYRHDVARILERLGDKCEDISGASPSKSTELISRFNSGQLPVLAGHPASMGHGLNLQSLCRHVIWFGITWNFEYYDQAIRRVYRQGQQAESVIIYHLVAKDTLDEKVMRVLHSKEKDQRTLLASLAAD